MRLPPLQTGNSWASRSWLLGQRLSGFTKGHLAPRVNVTSSHTFWLSHGTSKLFITMRSLNHKSIYRLAEQFYFCAIAALFSALYVPESAGSHLNVAPPYNRILCRLKSETPTHTHTHTFIYQRSGLAFRSKERHRTMSMSGS